MPTSDSAGSKAIIDVKQLSGFLVNDAPKGFVRLSRTEEGDDCLEISENDIQRRTSRKLPNGAEQTVLFVDRNATILRCKKIRISREAEFLQGTLLAAFADTQHSDDRQVGRALLAQLYVAKSETTLTCWEDCTVAISTCGSCNTLVAA